jgi:hypothetical protein
MPISKSSKLPAKAGDMSQSLPANEQGRENVSEYIMSKIEYARSRARKDLVWLMIAVGIFAGALTLSLVNFGSGRALAGGSCASQCKAQYGQCVISTGDRSSCQQQFSTCLDSCGGG